MISLNRIEKYLREKILPELERGRPDFDKPHTEATVKKLKEILKYSPGLKVDPAVLMIAAYAHDWGYVDMFSNGKPVQLKEVDDAEEEHMEIGTRKLRNLLDDSFFNFLEDAQKERAIHLVKTHDNLEDLKDIDELILMEADLLGAADVSLVKPTFDFESNEKWAESVRERKIPKLITEFSKKEAERLVSQRERYYRKKYKKN